MKSEPDCYSIDDLKKDKIEPWDGVRNYQVRNMIRDDMKKGDKALFYHSNCPEIGVVGTMTIHSSAYPDPTQFDPTLIFSSPQQVEALKRIVKRFKSKTTKVFLKYYGRNNEKISVGVDPKSDHPDPKSDPENPTWLLVDVRFESKFPRTVTLAEIKADQELQRMVVAQKGSRLSVTPVKKEQYEKIVKLARLK